jgi:hypothetical protein
MTQLNIVVPIVPMPQLGSVAGPPLVRAMPAGHYLVHFPGPVRPANHIVRKDRSCVCALGEACPAVQAVTDYLRRGGERAPDPKPGSFIPASCPICGGQVHFEPMLCSPARGAGWVCLNSAQSETIPWPTRYWHPGEKHYWQHQWAELGRLRFGHLPAPLIGPIEGGRRQPVPVTPLPSQSTPLERLLP